jgi:hypothetical protein
MGINAAQKIEGGWGVQVDRWAKRFALDQKKSQVPKHLG